MTDIVAEALAAANEIDQLNARVKKLEKAIAIYMREDGPATDLEFDLDVINYFCEKYNE